MDLLRKEMERKKRALAQAKQGAGLLAAAADAAASGPQSKGGGAAASAPTRYLNAGQLRRRQEEEEERLRREKSGSKRPRTDAKSPRESSVPLESSLSQASSLSTTAGTAHKPPSAAAPASTSAEAHKTPAKRDGGDATADAAASAAAESQESMMDSSAISSRLRGLGLAIRLFGEAGDRQRLERLRRALALQQSTLQSLSEKQEFRLGAGHSIRNPFLDQDKRSAATAAAASESLSRRAASQAGKAKKEGGNEEEEDGVVGNGGDDDESDPHKRIYAYLKSLLVQWEHDLSLRPEAVRMSVAGKKDTNTLQQCKDYIAPLFKLLKRRQLEASLTSNLAKIVEYCKQGEFVRANDAYMDIAIGRAAWPIGVTQVGIHSRTGRSKIESSNVAHVMNSELQRKYLTSVKRLITYAQAKSSADPSKKVLN